MRGSGHEHGNLQLPGQHQQAGHMVDMLMGDQNGGKRVGIVSRSLHALESFAAGNSRVNEKPGGRTLHNRAVSPAAAGQHRDRNSHARSILPRTVETEVTSRLIRYFWVEAVSSRHSAPGFGEWQQASVSNITPVAWITFR